MNLSKANSPRFWTKWTSAGAVKKKVITISIRTIADDDLEVLSQRIRPIMRGTSGETLYMQPVHTRRTAFTWDPQPDGPTPSLRAIQDVTSFHTFAYYGFFKPSIYECIAAIPLNLLDTVVAFEIVSSPSTLSDLHLHAEALNQGFHVATTRLYALAD